MDIPSVEPKYSSSTLNCPTLLNDITGRVEKSLGVFVGGVDDGRPSDVCVGIEVGDVDVWGLQPTIIKDNNKR
jgi:hypothetical protein